MKLAVKRWQAIAKWHWKMPSASSDDTCGICQFQFDAFCPACKLPGDGCPPGFDAPSRDTLLTQLPRDEPTRAVTSCRRGPLTSKIASSAFSRSFDSQFAAIYFSRLHALRPVVSARAMSLWKQEGAELVEKVIALKTATTDSVVVGTLFKDMPAMPSLLKEYTQERSISGFDWAQKTTFTSDKDSLSLEDDTGRVKLVTNSADLHSVVTGMVVAIRGRLLETGELEVREYCCAGAPPQPAVSALPSAGECVLLVSGLALGSEEQSPIATQMLVDWVTGCAGSHDDQERASRVCRVVLAGNSLVDSTPETPPAQPWLKPSNESEQAVAGSLRRLDAVLSQLCAAVHVEVMPGETDPATYVLPQQPLSRVLLPVSSELNTLHLVPNPHEFEIGGRLFLGTAGQNIDNIEKLTTIGDRLELMRRTLEWRHLAPTAPHTLGCLPFDEKTGDPFIIDSLPHVYFAGNQPAFGCATLQGPNGSRVVTVLVPSFHKTRTAVLIDLASLAVSSITFTSSSAMVL